MNSCFFSLSSSQEIMNYPCFRNASPQFVIKFLFGLGFINTNSQSRVLFSRTTNKMQNNNNNIAVSTCTRIGNYGGLSNSYNCRVVMCCGNRCERARCVCAHTLRVQNIWHSSVCLLSYFIVKKMRTPDPGYDYRMVIIVFGHIGLE